MVHAIKQDCLVCFEQRFCPPLSYGCCHFDICVVCLEKWTEVNHGIARCPVCREIQFEKPITFFCLRCQRPSTRQQMLMVQLFIGQIIFLILLLLK